MKMHGCGPRGRDYSRMAALMMIGRGHRWGSGWGSGFDSGFGGERHGRHRGGRGRMFGAGELRLALLALLEQAPRHGYELIKAIEELTGGSYAPSPGVVYPTLNLLADEGLIEELPGESARKAFGVTEDGRKELAERKAEADALIERLKALGSDESKRDAPPVRRAVGNLMAALRDRAMAGEFDRETVHAVAEILDEAARKIERL